MEHHEQRALVIGRDRPERLVDLGVERHGDRSTPVAGRGRTRPVDGQVQLGGRPVEGLPPVPQLPGGQAALIGDLTQQGPLPQRVVRVLRG